MTTAELRRRAKRTIDQLSGARLRFVTDFLMYIGEQQPDAATKELLELPEFRASFQRGLKDVKAGRVKPWRKIRSDV